MFERQESETQRALGEEPKVPAGAKHLRCRNTMNGEHDFYSHRWGKNAEPPNRPLVCRYCCQQERDLNAAYLRNQALKPGGLS